MKRGVVVSICVVCLLASAATRVYDVELSENKNGYGKHPTWVGQTFTTVCDSIQWCAAFIGRPLSSGDYVFGIYDSTGAGLPLGEADTVCAEFDYEYAPAFFRPAVKVIKGVKYMLKISCSNQDDSVNYYYNDNNPYAYGEMIAGGQKSPGLDLAARVEGAVS